MCNSCHPITLIDCVTCTWSGDWGSPVVISGESITSDGGDGFQRPTVDTPRRGTVVLVITHVKGMGWTRIPSRDSLSSVKPHRLLTIITTDITSDESVVEFFTDLHGFCDFTEFATLMVVLLLHPEKCQSCLLSTFHRICEFKKRIQSYWCVCAWLQISLCQWGTPVKPQINQAQPRIIQLWPCFQTAEKIWAPPLHIPSLHLPSLSLPFRHTTPIPPMPFSPPGIKL